MFPDEMPSMVCVKFSGDGAKFSKNSSYVLLSLSLPGVAKDVLAGTGTLHTCVSHPGSCLEILQWLFWPNEKN